MSLPRRWVSHLVGLGVWLAGSALVGLWFGSVGWGLVAGFAIYVAYMLHNLYLLDRVMFSSGRMPLFETHGLWAEIVARTERIKARSRSRKRRYHRLVREVRSSTNAISDAGIILNAEYEVVWFNAAATTLLGLDPSRDLGSRIDNYLRRPEFVAYLNEPTGSGVVIPSPLQPDGTLEIRLIPYGRDQHLAIIRDITHETQIERTRRDFVANASHELRSPLTVITGYLDTMVDDDDLPDSWRAPVTEMLRQSHRMTWLLQDLIELTRLESSEIDPGDDFVDVRRMLADVVGEFKTRKSRPVIELHLESDAALIGSEPELHSVFSNLIGNAVRFTPESGRVDISWKMDDGAALFEVADTGIGIPADLIPRLTERFYRVDAGRSRATGGTGLGLAIVKHALQRHDSELEIESIEGEGSRFRCRFGSERVAERGSTQEQAV